MLFCKNKPPVNAKSEHDDTKRRSGIISKSFDAYGYNEREVYHYPKTKEEEELICSAVNNNEFLSNILQGKRLQYFVNCLCSKQVLEGEVLIRQGEIGSYLYISREGSFEVSVNDVSVNCFQDVRVFGELAILYSSKRRASIRALENGSVWVLDCPTFKKLSVKTAIEEQEEMVSFLSKVPILNTVTREKLYQVANLLKVEFYPTSTAIVKQCELGDKFYIIRAGSVIIEKDNSQLIKLSKGSYFGELALLNDEFRQATVIADAPGTECLTLTRKEFIDHFGEIDEFIKLKLEPRAPISYKEYTNINLEDLRSLQTIGTGAYGRVLLVQHKNFKNAVFALKYLKKVEICKESHQYQLFNEKNLHMACNSPFITRMYRTYKDPKYLYFLLEPCLGGDLWGLLHKQKKRCFEEDIAKFYAGCVIEGIQYLHDLGIIYRDLKPENVLIHHSGYAKIADFGFAKKTDSKEKTYTFVGTAEYVAPEIIQNKGYNKAVDYWAFGVFIFELLVGKTPFKTNDPGHLSTYKCIMKGIDNTIFPYYISRKAKSLIKKLCNSRPVDRLGCQRGGIKDIKDHIWFSNFSWTKLKNLQLEAPHKPNLLNNVDTSYFDKFKDDAEVPRDDFSNWDEEF